MGIHLNLEDSELAMVGSGVYVAGEFYSKAEILRTQFEQSIGQEGQHAGMTPLALAFREKMYCFLTAGAERCFSEDVLADLVGSLERFGSNVLSASHVSTPQVRVYMHGCSRRLLRDEIAAPWHFILSLTLDPRHYNRSWIKVLEENPSENGELGSQRTLTVIPVFNQLLVHRASEPYCVVTTIKAMNPVQAAVLVDGYLW